MSGFIFVLYYLFTQRILDVSALSCLHFLSYFFILSAIFPKRNIAIYSINDNYVYKTNFYSMFFWYCLSFLRVFYSNRSKTERQYSVSYINVRTQQPLTVYTTTLIYLNIIGQFKLNRQSLVLDKKKCRKSPLGSIYL